MQSRKKKVAIGLVENLFLPSSSMPSSSSSSSSKPSSSLFGGGARQAPNTFSVQVLAPHGLGLRLSQDEHGRLVVDGFNPLPLPDHSNSSNDDDKDEELLLLLRGPVEKCGCVHRGDVLVGIDHILLSRYKPDKFASLVATHNHSRVKPVTLLFEYGDDNNGYTNKHSKSISKEQQQQQEQQQQLSGDISDGDDENGNNWRVVDHHSTHRNSKRNITTTTTTTTTPFENIFGMEAISNGNGGDVTMIATAAAEEESKSTSEQVADYIRNGHLYPSAATVSIFPSRFKQDLSQQLAAINNECWEWHAFEHTSSGNNGNNNNGNIHRGNAGFFCRLDKSVFPSYLRTPVNSALYEQSPQLEWDDDSNAFLPLDLKYPRQQPLKFAEFKPIMQSLVEHVACLSTTTTGRTGCVTPRKESSNNNNNNNEDVENEGNEDTVSCQKKEWSDEDSFDLSLRVPTLTFFWENTTVRHSYGNNNNNNNNKHGARDWFANHHLHTPERSSRSNNNNNNNRSNGKNNTPFTDYWQPASAHGRNNNNNSSVSEEDMKADSDQIVNNNNNNNAENTVDENDDDDDDDVFDVEKWRRNKERESQELQERTTTAENEAYFQQLVQTQAQINSNNNSNNNKHRSTVGISDDWKQHGGTFTQLIQALQQQAHHLQTTTTTTTGNVALDFSGFVQEELLPYLPSRQLTMLVLEQTKQCLLHVIEWQQLQLLLDTWRNTFQTIPVGYHHLLQRKSFSNKYANSHGFVGGVVDGDDGRGKGKGKGTGNAAAVVVVSASEEMVRFIRIVGALVTLQVALHVAPTFLYCNNNNNNNNNNNIDENQLDVCRLFSLPVSINTAATTTTTTTTEVAKDWLPLLWSDEETATTIARYLPYLHCDFVVAVCSVVGFRQSIQQLLLLVPTNSDYKQAQHALLSILPPTTTTSTTVMQSSNALQQQQQQQQQRQSLVDVTMVVFKIKDVTSSDFSMLLCLLLNNLVVVAATSVVLAKDVCCCLLSPFVRVWTIREYLVVHNDPKQQQQQLYNNNSSSLGLLYDRAAIEKATLSLQTSLDTVTTTTTTTTAMTVAERMVCLEKKLLEWRSSAVTAHQQQQQQQEQGSKRVYLESYCLFLAQLFEQQQGGRGGGREKDLLCFDDCHVSLDFEYVQTLLLLQQEQQQVTTTPTTGQEIGDEENKDPSAVKQSNRSLTTTITTTTTVLGVIEQSVRRARGVNTTYWIALLLSSEVDEGLLLDALFLLLPTSSNSDNNSALWLACCCLVHPFCIELYVTVLWPNISSDKKTTPIETTTATTEMSKQEQQAVVLKLQRFLCCLRWQLVSQNCMEEINDDMTFKSICKQFLLLLLLASQSKTNKQQWQVEEEATWLDLWNGLSKLNLTH